MQTMRTVVVMALGLASLLPTCLAPGRSVLSAAAEEAVAGGGRRPFAVEDVFRLAYATDPRIAPDGGSVVFVREHAEVTVDQWFANLWWVPTTGGEPRPLTSGAHRDSQPRWSPDGTRLAFLSDRDGATQLYLLELASGALTRLTDGAQPPTGISWSPDGRWLAYAARVPAPQPLADLLPKPPAGAAWASPPRIQDRLPLAADSGASERAGEDAWHLAAGWLRLFVVPVGGGPPRRVTASEAPVDELHLDPVEPEAGTIEWTPDGRHLVVSALLHDDRELRPLDTEIYQVAVDLAGDGAAGNLEPLTHRRGPDLAPAVSPDGRLVAYVGFDDRGDSHQLARLSVVDRATRTTRLLTPDLDRSVATPRWAAGEEALLVQYHDRGDTKIARVGLDGSVRELAGNLGNGYSAYGGGSFTVAPGGRYAYTYTAPQVPIDVAVGDMATPGDPVRRITDLNAELLAARLLAPVRELHLVARDGAPLHGWLVEPPVAVAGRPPPLVLDIHGGPHRDYGARFDLEKQVWAARGYAVLYLNPRGSVGYGEAFANRIQRSYPGPELLDLEAAVDAMIAAGAADPERLYVTGGSGGALLTLWVIGHSDRYRAAVAIYPLVDWSSFALSTDISARILHRWLPGFPWEHPEHYRTRSPLALVGRVTTPTLLIVGDEDRRTPPTQGEQYFTALRHRGVEAALVHLPGEPHYAERRPSHLAARVALTVGWFDLHPPPGAAAPVLPDLGSPP